MNEVKIFNNSDFGSVRSIIIDNEPYFVAKDIAEILGYTNPQKAVRDHVDEDDKRVNESFTVKGTQGILINESGLYSLIMSSKLPNAKKFKHWVTSDVLPSIRKTGGYKIPTTIPEQIQLLAHGYTEINQRVDTVETKVNELENTMTLDYGQQSVLSDTVNKTVLSVLGGKGSNAYNAIGKKVFAECNHDLKSFFKVNARANVPKKRFEEALRYAENWKPCTNTVMMISNANAQENFVF